MKPTRGGMAISLVAISLSFAYVIFKDFQVELALFFVLLIIASEALWVGIAVRRPESKIALERGEPGSGRNAPLYPGDESVEEVRAIKRIGGKVEFDSKVPFLAIEPEQVSGRAGEAALRFRFKTPFSGEYSGDQVGVRLTGPIGLFSWVGAIPFAVKYAVYPRLLSVASATVKLLGKNEIGETPVEMPGVGSEFYEMRGYQPGDDFRNVNWKATARTGEVIVVEHMREVGSSFLLVLDARAPGFYDVDRLASAYLSVANGLKSSSVKFGILVHDGKRVTALTPDNDPDASLGMALQSAVRVVRLDSSPEFLELIPGRLASRLRQLERRFDDRSILSGLSSLRNTRVRSVVNYDDPWMTVSRYVREGSTRSVIFVTGLFDEPSALMELAWQLRHFRDAELAVVNPCEPWAYATDEEEARRLRERAQKLGRALGKAGIRYYRGEPLDVARRVLAA